MVKLISFIIPVVHFHFMLKKLEPSGTNRTRGKEY